MTFIKHQVTWQNVTGSINAKQDFQIEKTLSSSWGNSGAFSNEFIPAGQDGKFIYCPTEGLGVSWSRAFGISTADTGQSYADIEFAFILGTGVNLFIYESGIYSGHGGPTAAVSQTYEISREGTAIKYYMNGSLFHTSATTAPIGDLFLDLALFETGAQFQAALIETDISGGAAPLVRGQDFPKGF